MITFTYEPGKVAATIRRLEMAPAVSREVLRKAIATPEALYWLRNIGVEGLFREVYAAYQPKKYERTMNLLWGVVAEVEEDTPDRLSVVLRIRDEDQDLRCQGNGGEGLLYARFFLPDMVGGWLKRTVPETMPRDFLLAWVQSVQAGLPGRIRRAMDETAVR
jgi:hypothetical protein